MAAHLLVVSLPSNPSFSALKALATEGIQKGHMSLHSQNIALMAGAEGEEIPRIAQRLVELGTVRIDVAEAELKKLREGR